jgi:nicotinamidase-related amidase
MLVRLGVTGGTDRIRLHLLAHTCGEKPAQAAFAQALGVHRVFVGGLATDYCVLETVSDARAHGLDVIVLKDAIRAVSARPDDEARAFQPKPARGATLFTPTGHSAAPPSHHW